MDRGRTDPCGNPLHQWSLLPAQAPGAWARMLAWIEAEPHETHADMQIDRKSLVLLDSGSTQLDCGFGRRSLSFDLRPGAIGYFAPGCHLRASRWRWAPARRIAIDLAQVEQLDPTLAEAPRQAPKAADIEFHDPQLAALVRGLAREAAAGCPHGQLFTESLLLGVSLRLQQQASTHHLRERGRLSASQLRLLNEFIDAHLGQRLSVATLAQRAGFSASQLVRLLKNTVQQTPHQYVLERRLRQAHALVQGSPLPLVLIAQETGFASQSHLTTAFARRYGEPPGAVRRHARTALVPDLEPLA